ncbi:MAG: sigma-70 family RNA polymerase sigma factor [Sphingobacteriales bacterium]|nr:sigma-70 family RNA polymerase sigma factor [Sphingobacteriales bacterium]OJW00124.1 MAG: hypothetical protein BGO52_03285 [Sphingobacteriales bacterium 44-61]
MDAKKDIEVIFEKMRGGDLAVFDQLYYYYSKSVTANISRLIKEPEDVKDILQDVFVQLWLNRNKLDPNLSLEGWLMTVSRNLAINFLKRQIRTQLMDEHEGVTENLLGDDGSHQKDRESRLVLLEMAIQQLPARQRDAFTLCKLQRKTYSQAAEQLKLSPHTVREYVSIAIQTLKLELQDKFDVSMILLIAICTCKGS